MSMSNWGKLSNEDDNFLEALYQQYVPACGKANTVGGEIVRAINRVVYKYYNDGDTVYRYYSCSYNHSWACDTFLDKYVPTYISMKDITDDFRFENALCKNLKNVVDWLRANPAIFEVSNSEDCLDGAPYQEWQDEDDEYDEEDDDYAC